MAEETQTEHAQISNALEVEKLEVNLFRSKSLYLPQRARGVFGGQVISQALVAATNCVDPMYRLHSLHCYFLLSASSAIPIIYQVDRVRSGRSYSSMAVKAIQNGRNIFIMMCSFQKPEPWQPQSQWPMPDVPRPEDCRWEEDVIRDLSKQKGIHPSLKKYFELMVVERGLSPIAVKMAKEMLSEDNTASSTYMYWMQARHIPKYEAPFQKCILAYLSDLYFISSGPRIWGLKKYSKGPDAIAMTSTVDHSVHYYNDDFHCGDWMLYVMDAPRMGSGRGVMHGRLYTREGTLIAVTTQEGVVRADIRGPVEEKAKL